MTLRFPYERFNFSGSEPQKEQKYLHGSAAVAADCGPLKEVDEGVCPLGAGSSGVRVPLLPPMSW